MNLAFSDILTGFSMISYFILLNTFPANIPNTLCYFQISLTLLTAFTSFAIVTSLAIDRCLCLYFEQFYITKVTVRVVAISQACTWLLACVFSFSLFFDAVSEYPVCLYRFAVGDIGKRFQFSYGVLVRVLSAGAYILIYAKIRNMRKNDITNGVQVRGILKTTFKLLTIGLTYHAMYLPMFCCELYTVLVSGNSDPVQGFGVIGSSFAILNSLVNPFIYAWRFPECRLQLKIIMCFWKNGLMKRVNEKRKRILVSFLDIE